MTDNLPIVLEILSNLLLVFEKYNFQNKQIIISELNLYNRISKVTIFQITQIINSLHKIHNYLPNELHQIIKDSIYILNSLINTNYLIVTHNGRIRCFLADILNQSEHKLDGNIRFKNCCILKLSFQKIKDVLSSSLKLIYSGEVNNNRKHFEASDIDIIFKEDETKRILRKLRINENDIDGIMNFFIVRHGEGFHNTVGLAGKALGLLTGELNDAVLTSNGYNQSINAGLALNSYLIDKGIFINKIFCSDLKRTRETLSYMLTKIDKTLIELEEIIILPCSHEVAAKGGDCDSRQGMFVPPENLMTCNVGNDEDEQCENLCCSIISGYTIIPVNWKYYLEFYGGHKRGTFTSSQCDCKDTSMISIAICTYQDKNVKKWILER